MWTPLIKGSYRMYIDNSYIPSSEENIGVIASEVYTPYLRVEKPD